MNILIVDDYQENRYLLEVLLKGHGYQVSSAIHGEHALERLKQGKFDLIISDILMPVMDGYQLCLKCKTDEALKNISFIFYTATYIEKQDEELARQLGADEFIRKPAEPDEFMHIINNVIKESSSRKVKSISLEPGVLQAYTDRVTRKLDKKIIQLEDEIARRKAAEQSLRESEAKYRSLVETGGAGIVTINLNTQLTFVNERFCQMMGYSRPELLKKHIAALVHPEDYATIETFLNIGANTKTQIVFEFRAVHKSGQLIWLLTNPTAIIIDEKITGYNAIMHDITALKEAEAKLQEGVLSLQKTLDDTVIAMAKILEIKDPYTAGHQVRVAELASAIARKLDLPEDQVKYINTSAVIHDIGKIYVPPDILNKPGKLSDLEFKIIQEHPKGGYDILKGIEFGSPIAEIVWQHHERIDGSGYPQKLRGNDVLLASRILAVADVVEAMSSYRPYRPALGIEKALEEIRDNSGTKYDERVVDSCLELFNKGEFSFRQYDYTVR